MMPMRSHILRQPVGGGSDFAVTSMLVYGDQTLQTIGGVDIKGLKLVNSGTAPSSVPTAEPPSTGFGSGLADGLGIGILSTTEQRVWVATGIIDVGSTFQQTIITALVRGQYIISLQSYQVNVSGSPGVTAKVYLPTEVWG